MIPFFSIATLLLPVVLVAFVAAAAWGYLRRQTAPVRVVARRHPRHQRR